MIKRFITTTLLCLITISSSIYASQVIGYKTHKSVDFAKLSSFLIEGEEDGTNYKILQLTALPLHQGNEGQVISHVLFERSGDTNSLALELGQYKIENNTLTLYSYWAKRGDAPASPFGVRKKIYQWNPAIFRYDLKEDILYVEQEYWKDNNGRTITELLTDNPFLTKTPEKIEDKQLLEHYIEAMQGEEGQAVFIRGEKAKALFNEVKQQLATEIEKNTGNWEQWQQQEAPGSGMGFKK